MKKLFLPLMAIIAYVFSIFIKYIPITFERYYVEGINKITIQLLSRISAIIPFSIAEIIYLSQWILIPIFFLILVFKIFKGNGKSWALFIVNYLALAYLLFMCLWGFNYSRMPISAKLGLEIKESTKEELYELNLYLVNRANTQRLGVLTDQDGLMKVNDDYKGVFMRAAKGLQFNKGDLELFSGSYGIPKSIYLSKPMLYTGITGMYFPFTGEANINTAIPDLMLPATVLHEMAHQRGVAPEDEANFIAYIIGNQNIDSDFKYSTTVLALIHSINALNLVSPEDVGKIKTKYSEGLKRDLIAYSDFWNGYDGKVQEIADDVNDTYLRSNGEKDGVQSYGQMVDLLLGEYRKMKTNK